MHHAIKHTVVASIVILMLTLGIFSVAISAHAASDEAAKLSSIESKLTIIGNIVALMTNVYGAPEAQTLTQSISTSTKPINGSPSSLRARLAAEKMQLEHLIRRDGELHKLIKQTEEHIRLLNEKLGVEKKGEKGPMKRVCKKERSGTSSSSPLTMKCRMIKDADIPEGGTGDGGAGSGDAMSAVFSAALTQAVSSSSSAVTASVVMKEVQANAEQRSPTSPYLLDATIEFEVTAEDGDIYIPKTAVRSGSKSAGVNFRMQDGAGKVVTTGNAPVGFITQFAEEVGNYFVVREGETEEFDVNVWYEPAQPGSYTMRLLALNWNTIPAAPNRQTLLRPVADFVTPVVEVPAYVPVGTYIGYLNGKQFIVTKNISEADALANCKLNATNNPTASIRCTWGTKEIYKFTPTPNKLTVRASTSDPDASTLVLDQKYTSELTNIFTFDLDTKGNPEAIRINSIPVTISVDALTVGAFVNDVQLNIHEKGFRAKAGTDGKNRVYTFDTTTLDLAPGERTTAELHVQFKPMPQKGEGKTIRAFTSASGISAKGSTYLTGTQLAGSAKGASHTMRTRGTSLSSNDQSATLKLNSDSTTEDDEGVFVVRFNATAFDTDAYVNKSAVRGTAMGTAGVSYKITDGSGNAVSGGSVVAAVSSTADTDGTRYLIREGETETFTLTVEYDPASSGFYALQVYGLNYATTNANPTTQQQVMPAADYETDALAI